MDRIKIHPLSIKFKGENNPGWKGGRPKCIDCGKIIQYRCIRCWDCYLKYKHKVYVCVICGKHCSRGSLRCSDCYIDIMRKRSIKHGKYTKRKCVDCGKTVSEGHIRCKKCNIVWQRGENAPNYIDGNSKELYSLEFNDQLKEKIRERDNYECQCCGMTEEEHLIVYGRKLNIHHIDYNKKNNKEDNLITVCLQCNIRANYNKNYWKEYYLKKLVEK